MSWQHILEHTIQLSDGHIIKYVNILGPVVGWFERSTCYEDVEESMRVGPRPTQSVSALCSVRTIGKTFTLHAQLFLCTLLNPLE